MYNEDIPFNQETFKQVETLFKKISKIEKRMKLEEKMAMDYDKHRDFFAGLTKDEVQNTKVDWDGFYENCKAQFSEIVSDQQELANYLIELLYNKLQGKGTGYKILWNVAREGIMQNLKHNQKGVVYVPVETEDGTGTEYLGRYYKMTEYKGEI